MTDERFRQIFREEAAQMRGAGAMSGTWPHFTITGNRTGKDTETAGDSCALGYYSMFVPAGSVFPDPVLPINRVFYLHEDPLFPTELWPLWFRNRPNGMWWALTLNAMTPQVAWNDDPERSDGIIACGHITSTGALELDYNSPEPWPRRLDEGTSFTFDWGTKSVTQIFTPLAGDTSGPPFTHLVLLFGCGGTSPFNANWPYPQGAL